MGRLTALDASNMKASGRLRTSDSVDNLSCAIASLGSNPKLFHTFSDVLSRTTVKRLQWLLTP